MYSGVKQLTTLEEYDKATLTISPLAGNYHGYFTDAPKDTFTVNIKYYDSAKYDVGTTGSKNFYRINNMPNGYLDSTSSQALAYPELRKGMELDAGYKCFSFSSATCITGYGWLSKGNDSLFINYGSDYCGHRKFIGVRR